MTLRVQGTISINGAQAKAEAKAVAGELRKVGADATGMAAASEKAGAGARALAAGAADASGDLRALAAAERQAAGVPPYGRMAGIILSGSDVQQVFDLGNTLARNDGALRRIGAQVYGPAPAPIARVRGRHRVRLLVKAAKGAPLQRALADWVAPLRIRGDLRLAIDIDPQSFF